MSHPEIEKWGVAEVSLTAPNITDIPDRWSEDLLHLVFTHRHRSVRVAGFHDGEDIFRARFMPDAEGEWTWRSESRVSALDGRSGTFRVLAPSPANHGPVGVHLPYGLVYADGTPFSNIGTTAYAWIHQEDTLVAETLRTLRDAPFNKMRMLVFPKHYRYNENEPPLYPFRLLHAGESKWGGSHKGESPRGWEFDWATPNPAFFQRLDRAVAALCELGIEADLILFHPYDRWGFRKLPAEVEDRYLRYVAARLAAYRNVWWSFANEWDLLTHRSIHDWERYARIIQESDPSGHLRSIHNWRSNYDHRRTWVTHVSYQGHPSAVADLRREFTKPVVVDECRYEGDIAEGWGNITAPEIVDRFWTAVRLGGFCGHSETYYNDQEVLWWGKGGSLRGESSPRLAFLRRFIEAHGGGVYEPLSHGWSKRGQNDAEFLFYPEQGRPREARFQFPDGKRYGIEIFDAWNMTLETSAETVEGDAVILLPARPYVGIRALRLHQ
jgi:hypothetical protein